MKRKLTLSVAAAVLATAGVAIAAPAMKPQGDMTRAQAEARAGEMFAKLDVNGDGTLDQADRAARQSRMFERLDTDKNGQISEAEFAAAREKRGQRGAGMAAGEHQGMKGHHKGGRGMHGGRGMMKMADTNGDGAISRAEFTAGAIKRFDMADTDRNGTVTQAERQAARAAMKAQWQQRRAAQQAPAN